MTRVVQRHYCTSGTWLGVSGPGCYVGTATKLMLALVSATATLCPLSKEATQFTWQGGAGAHRSEGAAEGWVEASTDV